MLEFALLLRCPFPHLRILVSLIYHSQPHRPFPVPQTGLRGVCAISTAWGPWAPAPHDEFLPKFSRCLNVSHSPRGHPHCGTPTMSLVVCFSLLICFSLVILRIAIAFALFTGVFFFLHQTVSSVGVSEMEGFECFFTLLTSSLAHLSQLHGYWQKT